MWIRYAWFSYFTKNFGTSERSQKPVQLGKGQPVSSSGSREQRETPDVHVWEEDDVDSVKVAICTTHLLNVGNNFILLTIQWTFSCYMCTVYKIHVLTLLLLLIIIIMAFIVSTIKILILCSVWSPLEIPVLSLMWHPSIICWHPCSIGLLLSQNN